MHGQIPLKQVANFTKILIFFQKVWRSKWCNCYWDIIIINEEKQVSISGPGKEYVLVK